MNKIINTKINLANLNYLLDRVDDCSFNIGYSVLDERSSVDISDVQFYAYNNDKDFNFTGTIKEFCEIKPNFPVVIEANFIVVLPDKARAIVPFIKIHGLKKPFKHQKKLYGDFFFQDSTWLESQIVRAIGKPEFYKNKVDFNTKTNFFGNILKQTLNKKHLQPYSSDEINELHSYAHQAAMDAAHLFNPALSNKIVAVITKRVKFAFLDLWTKDGVVQRLEHHRQNALMEIRNYLEENAGATYEEIVANTIATTNDCDFFEYLLLNNSLSLDSAVQNAEGEKTYGEIVNVKVEDRVDYRSKIEEVLLEEGMPKESVDIFIYTITAPHKLVAKDFNLTPARIKEIRKQAINIIKKHPEELNPNIVVE